MRVRFMLLVAMGALALVPAGCGGGGSSSSGGSCSVPGTLRALAIAGQMAPGTGGNFLGFASSVPMDIAPGGWAVFGAGTTDPTANRVLYVARQDGVVLPVFMAGDVVPNAGGGTIVDILGAWVNTAPRILALVSITGDGGGRTRGLLTARLDGTGTVVDKHEVVYNQRDMTPTGLGGMLTSIDPARTHLALDGGIFFTGTTSTGDVGLWHVLPDATGLTLLVGTGSALPGALSATAFGTVEAHDGGVRYAFVAQRNDAGATYGLYTGQLGVAGYGLVAEEGMSLAPGRTLDTLFATQPFTLYASGSIVFAGRDSTVRDEILLGAPGLPPVELAREGDAAPGTDGNYGNLDMLANPPGAGVPFFRAGLVGSSYPISLLFYAITSTTSDPVLALYDGRDAPDPAASGTTFTTIFPGLSERTDTNADGSIAFSNVLSDGNAGAFWVVRSCGIFTLGLSGQTAPGADVFTNGGTWRTDTAGDAVLFLAPLQTAGSGIFRQGP